MANDETTPLRTGDDWLAARLASGQVDGLAAGDHFAGMPSEDPLPCPVPTCNVEGLNDAKDFNQHFYGEHSIEERLAAGRAQVVGEIVDEVDNGDAHLMTRNEVAAFIEWLVTDESATGLGSDDNNINGVIYEFMNDGEWVPSHTSFANAAAKAWFVKKGYE